MRLKGIRWFFAFVVFVICCAMPVLLGSALIPGERLPSKLPSGRSPRDDRGFRTFDSCEFPKLKSDSPKGAQGTTISFRNDNHTYVYPQLPVSELPKVAMVTVAFGSSANQYRAEISALNCYAALHGYPFYVEHVQLQPDRYFSFTKTRTVMKYMPHYQWIFYIDNDAVIVNRTKRLEEYLDDNYDLIIQKRDSNHEVHAAVFFVRNSDYGWFFMRKWIGLSDNGQAPFGMGDNAALVIMTMLEVKPTGYENCLEIMYAANATLPPRIRRQTYNSHLMKCFHNSMKSLKDRPNVEHMKILQPLEGYLRSFQTEWKPASYYSKLFPEVDFVLHGKHLAVDLLTPADIYCEYVPDGITRPELFHTLDSASEAAKKMGYYYPPKPYIKK
mmetsp:Transcript_41476/g.67317  ORF Transcript_41476/g.67317 Transcript_41476/m.67317 type:complete len:386 (-) Transcript_41476:247-1404(-)